MNSQLIKARSVRNDEYYTRYDNIDAELSKYSDFFNGKSIYCNCDDPYKSNFVKYFVIHFNDFHLKQLTCTYWNGESSSKLQLLKLNGSNRNDSKCTVIKRVCSTNIQDVLDDTANISYSLSGNGSYDSPECREIMKTSDIVITNPPFSKISDYISFLISNSKKFIIIAPKYIVVYKQLFPFFKDGMIQVGYKRMNSDMWFKSGKDASYDRIIAGEKQKKLMCCWFTNLDIEKHHEPYVFKKIYNPSEYPTYSNYNAIEVSSIYDIPDEYSGMMGVPLTFFDVYNPDQFEIIDVNPHFLYTTLNNTMDTQLKLPGKTDPYARIIIRRK